VGLSLRAELSTEKITQLVTDAATELTAAKFGAFFYNVEDEKGESYMLFSLSGAPRKAFEKFPMPKKTSIFGPTFRGEGTIRIDDVTKDSRYGQSAPFFGMPKGHLPVKSYLAVPVVSRSGKVIGGLFFGHPDAGIFTEKVQQIAEAIAAQTAVAMDNAHLYNIIKQAEERFRLTFENAGVGIAHVDMDGRWLEVNDKYCNILGYTREEILKMTFRDITHPEDLEESLKRTDQIRAGEISSYESDKRYIKKDGSIVWVHVTVSMARGEDGKPLYSIVSAQNVTDKKLVEEEIRQSKELAEEANRAKSRFLANMSHEIRTPLGVMIGFADLALDTIHSPQEVKNYLAAIKRNGQELTRIIGEVLDLSKIEANRLEIENVQFSLSKLLDDVLSFLELRAHEKNIELKLRKKEPLPDYIETDPTRLRQILFNLIGNAIKFTEKGAVVVGVEMLSSATPGAPVKLKFTIEDSGIGVSKEQQENLFQPFMQADSSTTRRYGGTGLGLMLSKQLARALGGDLKLEKSEAAMGSVFSFTIGAGTFLDRHDSKIEEKKEGFPESQRLSRELPLEHIKVLLVEDSMDNQILVSRYLKAAGAEVDLASNGQEGIDKAERFNYDLVLMDIQMPVLDGHEATRRLREKGFQKPIIALTAHAFREERARALGGGFSDYLTKPINRKSLLESAQRSLDL
jgi:PAS domain S-box-containing protein